MSKVPCGGFELDDSLVINDGKLGLAPGAGGSEVVRLFNPGFSGSFKWFDDRTQLLTFAEADELYSKWITGSIRIMVCAYLRLKSGESDVWVEVNQMDRMAADSGGNTYDIKIGAMLTGEYKSVTINH